MNITAETHPQAATEPPLFALRLGYAGLIPFVGGALLVWLVWPQMPMHAYATMALSAYAAVIVSFLGGIHWGIAFREAEPRPSLFVWGIVPSLAAWVAVMMPPSAGLVIHALMLFVCYLVDRKVYPEFGLQRWLTLRFRLSMVAAASCLLGAAGT